MCAEALCSSLTVENAANVLRVADMHSAHQLKSITCDFISSHADDVMETQGWETMLRESPDLVADAFRALAKQQVRTFGGLSAIYGWFLIV